MKRTGIVLMSLLMIAAVALISCSGSSSSSTGDSRQVKNGDTVQVNYTGKLQDGNMFDTSIGRDPLQFSVGKGDVIEGFDKAAIGMKVGEKKIIKIPADQAYGPYRKELVFTVSRKLAPAGANPTIGGKIQGVDQDGKVFQATILKIEGDVITVDSNHPLAGKDLTFEIELVKIL